MSDHHRIRGSHQPPRRSDLRLMLLYAGLMVCLFLVFAGTATVLRQANRVKLVIPDEKAAAASLLASQFTGPRYFQVPPGDLRNSDGVAVKNTAEPHITTEAAMSQAETIIKERQLDAAGAAKVRALIDRLSEQPTSRAVGAQHVNLLRLNLALDTL